MSEISENLCVEIYPNNGKWVWVVKCLNYQGNWYPSGDGGSEDTFDKATARAYRSLQVLSSCEEISVEKLEQNRDEKQTFSKGNKEKGYKQAIANLAYHLMNMVMSYQGENENPLESLALIYQNENDKIKQFEDILLQVSNTYGVPLSQVEIDIETEMVALPI